MPKHEALLERHSLLGRRAISGRRAVRTGEAAIIPIGGFKYRRLFFSSEISLVAFLLQSHVSVEVQQSVALNPDAFGFLEGRGKVGAIIQVRQSAIHHQGLSAFEVVRGSKE